VHKIEAISPTILMHLMGTCCAIEVLKSGIQLKTTESLQF
jgi:hypothetical protein